MDAPGEGSRVLVLGDDMRSFLAVVRSLGRRGIEVHAAPYDPHAPALVSRYVRQVHHLPAYSRDGEDWCRAVEGLVSRISFDLVIPCCDRGLLMFDAHRERFAALPIALPSREAIALLFDKHATRRLAESLGVPVARGRLLRAGDTAADLAADFGLPLFLKPRHSYDLRHLGQRCNVRRLDSVEGLHQSLARIGEPSEWIVESSFAGTGIGVSLIADEGRLLTAFQHRRLREPARGGGSSKRVSEALRPDLLEAAAEICRAASLTGVAMTEFREDERTGAWILVEVNARFWGSLPLPLALGVDFPGYLYDLLVGGRKVGPVGYEAGVCARNLLINSYDFLFRNPEPLSFLPLGRALARGSALPWRWLRGRETIDEFVVDDPRPGLQQILYVARVMSGRVGRSVRLRVAPAQSSGAKL